MNQQRRSLLAATAGLAVLGAAGCSTTDPQRTGSAADQRRAIDAGADAALSRLYAQQPGTRELVASARGVLVFPTFVSAGFIVGGGSGTGVLRRGATSAGYYRMTEASAGLLAGAQSQAVFILFMTDDALRRFEQSSGWTIGADANVTFVNAGANAQITTQTAGQQVVGFVLTNGGLMANIALNGSKISRLTA